MTKVGGVAVVLALLGSAACGNNNNGHLADAPVSGDARTIDAPPIDAPPPKPLPAYELTAGGGTLTGAHHKMDVQIGHAMSQAPIVGASHTLQGNSAVKP